MFGEIKMFNNDLSKNLVTYVAVSSTVINDVTVYVMHRIVNSCLPFYSSCFLWHSKSTGKMWTYWTMSRMWQQQSTEIQTI